MSPSKGRIWSCGRRVALDDLGELVADDLPLPLGPGEDVVVVLDEPHELVVLVDDPLPLQGGEAAQLHLEDGAGLDLVDVEEFHEAVAGDLDRGAGWPG